MIFCAYDDRKEAEPGIRLLIASLYRYNPRASMVLCYPAADDAFRSWLCQFRNVSLQNDLIVDHLGWNVKPRLLSTLLERTQDQVVWMDTDIIVTKEIEPLFDGLSTATLVCTEEALWGQHSDANAARAQAWGFEIGRVLPFCLNTGVVRVTPDHRRLLAEWEKLLAQPEYLDAQELPIPQRPNHLVGDQDVLTALLCRSDFADVDLKILRRGADILQIFGLKSFTTCERLLVMRRGLPAFVHAQQFKPWRSSNGYSALQAAYLDTSPYTHVAWQYESELGPDAGWLKPQRPMGRMLLALGFANPVLAGMPIAVGVDIAYPIAKRLRNLVRKVSF